LVAVHLEGIGLFFWGRLSRADRNCFGLGLLACLGCRVWICRFSFFGPRRQRAWNGGVVAIDERHMTSRESRLLSSNKVAILQELNSA
jgi:hypothetical protein